MTCPEPRSGAAVRSFQSRGLFGPFAPSLRSTAESRATCHPASPPSSWGCRGGQRTECVWTLGVLSCPSQLAHTHVLLSRLVLMLRRVMTTATHRAGGLVSDDMAGGREGAERLLSPARGRQEAELHHDSGDHPHEPGPPPGPAPSVPPCLHPCPWPSPGREVYTAVGGVQPHCKARLVRMGTEKGPTCRDAGGLGRSPTGPGHCRRPLGCSRAGWGSGPCERAHEGCSTGPGLTAGAALTPCRDRGRPPC